jgi:hypothetical protein
MPRCYSTSAAAPLTLLWAAACSVDSPQPELSEAVSSERPQGMSDVRESAASAGTPPARSNDEAATSSCQPDARACSPSGLAIPTRCSEQGTWEDGAACAAPTPFCLRGDCVECSVGAVRCGGANGNVPELCGPDGTWQAGAVCSAEGAACSAGACAPAVVGSSGGAGEAMAGNGAAGNTGGCEEGSVSGCVSSSAELRCTQGQLMDASCGAGLVCAFEHCAGGWTRQLGTAGYDEAASVSVDGAGNVIVLGITNGALTATANAGSTDIFVRKYDVNGTEVWTRQFGSDDIEYASAVSTDGSGNVIVTGTTVGVLPGQTVQRAGDSDAVIGLRLLQVGQSDTYIRALLDADGESARHGS